MIQRKILLVIGSLGPGGAERVIATMANYWAEAGHQVGLLTYAPCIADHYELNPRVKRISLDLLWDSQGLWDRLAGFIQRTLRLRRAIQSFAPEVVVSFIEQTNVMTLTALLATGIPVIVSEHTDPRHHAVGLGWRVLRRWLYPHADYVVILTESVRNWVNAFVRKEKVRVIPNPVRPLTCIDNEPPLPTGSKIVIAAGRLVPLKGFDVLIDAFAACNGVEKDWSLVILGEGPERAALEERIVRRGLERRVYLPGLVSPIEAWLRQADIFVLSSRYEGFPMVLLEAMSCGLSVVAFDCESGPAEIIRHEIDGVLVPAGDTAELSKAMERLMDDPSLRETLGKAASRNIQRFALPQVMTIWEDTIEAAVTTRTTQ